MSFLAGDAGQRLLSSLEPADVHGHRLLGTVERLRSECGPEAASLIVDLVAGRESALSKFGSDHPRWYTPTALQQASGAAAAEHRAERLARFGRVLELCTGIGGDSLALARAGAEVVSTESDPLLAAMARRNLSEAGLADSVRVHIGQAEDASLDGFDAIYADPSRRSGSRRSTSLNALSPSIEFLVDLVARAPATAIKLAPATGLHALQDAFPGAELEFVSVDGELKEAVVWAGAAALTPRRATILPSGAQLTGDAGEYLSVQEPGRFVADPDPALTRSGLFSEFAATTGVPHGLLAEQIAFLTSDSVPSTPFARYFRVIDALPFADRAIGERLRELGAGSVAVRCRGFPEPGDVVAARLQRRLRRNTRGETPYRLFVYRSGDRHHAVIAEFAASGGTSTATPDTGNAFTESAGGE